MRSTLFVLAFVIAFAMLIPAAGAQPAARLEPRFNGVIGLPMYADPPVAKQKIIRVFHPRLTSLWSSALDRPDQKTRRLAAEAIAQAHRDGWTDTGELPGKLESLVANGPSPLVRVAAAEALIELNVKEAAGTLLERSKGGGESGSDQTSQAPVNPAFVQPLDRALVNWNFKPARDIWIDRVSDSQTSLAVRRSAAKSLGLVRAPKALGPLRNLALASKTSSALRLDAARAFGQIAGGRESPPLPMRRIHKLADGSMVDKLVAAAILSGQGGDGGREALSILDRLIRGDQTSGAVIAEASRSLLAAGPELLAKHTQRLLQTSDPAAKLTLVEALGQLPQREGTAEALSELLGDPAVRVRTAARKRLIGWAKAGHTSKTLEVGRRTLDDSRWRAREQAGLIIAALASQDLADQSGSMTGNDLRSQRLVKLLQDSRDEVQLAAAHALLEIQDASVIPAMLDRANALSNQARTRRSQGGVNREALQQIGYVQTQLFMTFGRAKYGPADSLMRKYIPKGSPYSSAARAAAVYALGKIHEGAPQRTLAKRFASRLSDNNPMNPETDAVRRFAGIGLGRMGAKGQMGDLRRFSSARNAPTIANAARWAISQMTDQTLNPVKAHRREMDNYFLVPMGK